MAKQKKKPSASFKAKAQKKVNPSEEAAEAILPIWSSQQDRKRLFFDSGFNDNLEMTDESYKEWTNHPLAREALSVDMDASIDTRFGFGIFSSGHGKDNPTYLYTFSHRGMAIITGPEEISDKLKQKFKEANAEYVAQTDPDAANKINNFLAAGVRKNWESGRDKFSPHEHIEILLHAFCGCETPANKFLVAVGPDEMTLAKGTTVGAVIAAAGKPDNVMCTVDLDKPKEPQKNIMNFEGQPERYPAPVAEHPTAPAQMPLPIPKQGIPVP
jgi:hypothetical protein